MRQHGVRYNVARRAIDAASGVDPWDGYTADERARRNYLDKALFAELIAQQEAGLLAEIADDLGRQLYYEAIDWGDDPVVVMDGDELGDLVVPRLPRCTDRQDQAWRVRMGRAFCDIAADLRSGRAPIARNHAEDLALIIAAHQTRLRVEEAKEFAGDPLVLNPGEPPQDAAGHLRDWYPEAGRLDVKRHDFNYQALEEQLGGEADVYLLWNSEDGLECPDHPGNKQTIGDDIRPERWFDTFANTVPRDPQRGYPAELLSKLTDLARATLDRASTAPDATETPDSDGEAPRCMGWPDPDAPLGTVSATNFLVAGWRQQVLTAIGDEISRKHHFLPLAERAAKSWELDGRAVFSDIPEIALAQARRLLPGAAAKDGDEIIEILWAQPAVAGEYFPPRWFRVKAWKIEEHSAGPRDVPWLRVQWSDGTLSGMSFVDIVAIRRATDEALSPWLATVAEPQRIPTIEDCSDPWDFEDEEQEDADRERDAPAR